MMRVYVAHAMTGRTGDELLAESLYVKHLCSIFGDIAILDPVEVEQVMPGVQELHNPETALREYWTRDKAMIRKAHVLIDITGPRKSEGVAHEIGYARFFLWKPVIRVYPRLGPSVARFEDDVIAETIHEAIEIAYDRWGTFPKRLLWRLKLLIRCLPKFLYYQIREIK